MKFSQSYSIFLTLLIVYLLFSNFKLKDSITKFEEITVERINVVEKNGDLKMVISNAERQHPGMIDGKELAPRKRAPGMIFFNEEQDEIGGLIYCGNSNLVLSLDQYKSDQVMQVSHLTNIEGNNRYGIQIWERDKNMPIPKRIRVQDSLLAAGVSQDQMREKLIEANHGKLLSAERMFVGRNYDKEAGLFIKDEYGIDRLRIYVDSLNQPRLEVLDE